MRNRMGASCLAGRALLLLITVLLASGCYQKRFQWSPDGQHAAVITEQALYLADAEGHLAEKTLPSINAVGWFSDSQHLAVATSHDLKGSLAVARVTPEGFAVGRPIYSDSTIVDIRVAPGDRHIAFTVGKDRHSYFKLFVIPSDGATPAVQVSSATAAYPDWTPDGKEIVYFEAAGAPQADDDVMRLGALTQRRVVDDSGNTVLSEKPLQLAGVIFGAHARVRCLSDGRVLFNAAEINLPIAPADLGEGRDELFAVDRARYPSLIRLTPRDAASALPATLSFFEVSPDNRQVIIGTEHGGVTLLTLATGKVLTVQKALTKEAQGAPVWRKPGEFAYVKRIPDKTERPLEIVLWKNGEETVLSRNWSSKFTESVVSW